MNRKEIKKNRRAKEIIRLINDYLTYMIDENSILKKLYFTRVEMNPEEKKARIYYYVEPQEDVEPHAIQKEFNRYRIDIQDYINSQVIMKYPPKLELIYDKEYENYLKVQEILKEIEEEEKQNGLE